MHLQHQHIEVAHVVHKAFHFFFVDFIGVKVLAAQRKNHVRRHVFARNQLLGHAEVLVELVQVLELARAALVLPKRLRARVHQAVFVIDRYAVGPLGRQRIDKKGLVRSLQHLGRHVYVGAQRVPAAGVVAGFFVKALYAQVVRRPALVGQGLRRCFARCVRPARAVVAVCVGVLGMKVSAVHARPFLASLAFSVLASGAKSK